MTLTPGPDHKNVPSVPPRRANGACYPSLAMAHAAKGSLLLGLAALLCARLALAEPEREPTALALRLEYEVPSTCASAAAFASQVRARTALARFEDDAGAHPVHVSVTLLGNAYAGHLALVGRSGRIRERDVRGRDCAEVLNALALVTALAVDPNALLAPASPASTPRATPAAPPPPAPVPPDFPLPILPEPATTPHPETDPTPERAAHAPDATWRLDFGGGFVTMVGLAPDPLAGGGGYLEAGSTSARLVDPTVRLTVLGAANGVYARQTANFVLAAARLDVCSLHLASRTLSLRACGALEVGAVEGDGVDAVPGGKGVHAGEVWVDISALLRGRWSPGGGRFFFEGEAGAFVPATRASFTYTHVAAPIDTPASVGAVMSVGAGVRLW